MQHSTSEENYLKAIYSLAKDGKGVSTTTIAEQMHTKASSVTDMLRKLAQKNLVDYIKYKGVSLTDEGTRSALRTIRKHRLWEVFLVEKLGFGWDEVHDVAEQLEHIQSTKLTESLALFLGNPAFDPHGDPIPDANGTIPNTNLKSLAECNAGQRVRLERVKDGNPEFLQFLERNKLNLGEEFELQEVRSFDQSIEIKRASNEHMALSAIVSNKLFVSVL